MVEVISRISRGSVMDQIYIPKKRAGLAVGSYVLIKAIETNIETKTRPHFYHLKSIEPIKIEIIKEIFKIIARSVKADNIIITGSFLEKGFHFKDVDILVLSDEKADLNQIQNLLEKEVGIKSHLIKMTNKELMRGISTDPIYRLMMSKFVSSKRIVIREKININYKLLDLHLLQSQPFIYNFEELAGDEKFNLIRNMVAIQLFIERKKLSKASVDAAIQTLFKIESVQKIKYNLLSEDFRKKFKKLYKNLQDRILEEIGKASKQKKADG